MESLLANMHERRRAAMTNVNRRRTELLAATGVVFVVGSLALVLLSLGNATHDVWVPPRVLQATVIGLGTGFFVYVLAQERLLRRVDRAMLDERIGKATLATKVEQLAHLLDAARAVGSTLELGEVLPIILRRAMAMVGSRRSAILLVADDDLVVAAAFGSLQPGTTMPVSRLETAGGSGIPFHPTRLDSNLWDDRGSGAPTFAVPLISQGRATGVIVMEASSTADDELVRKLLSAFAAHASAAVTNAHLHRALRDDAARLRDGSWIAEEFNALTT